ncbi:SCO3374 family protein [Streptomyces sp. NPDC014776]|uniref:SCO3374 family protein n=1 Tax=unclassified Streptomyces TaxID=2593676 RepID=UPI003701744F
MAGAVPPCPTVPLPRRSPETGDPLRSWYENELGWPVVPGEPVRLSVGPRFDVLDVPAEAGLAALRHLGPSSPVAALDGRLWLWLAPGSAEELPGLLEWLEWGPLASSLDLRPLGPGTSVRAPLPAEPLRTSGLPGGTARSGAEATVAEGAVPVPRVGGRPVAGEGGVPVAREGGAPVARGDQAGRPVGGEAARAAEAVAGGRPGASQGAAVWVRPPVPGREGEASLPTMSVMPALSAGSAPGGGAGAPDLVRVVDTVATQCHRIRLRRACAQPLAFS